MLLPQIGQTIKMEDTFEEIYKLYPAFDNSHVFIGRWGHIQDCLAHIGSKGEVLFIHIFDNYNRTFGMLSNKEAIALQADHKRITIIDLETHETRFIKHNYKTESTADSNIVTFPDTKYLCIQENGNMTNQFMTLSYYKYPIKEDEKPFYVFEATQAQWKYTERVMKGNNHSMMIWFQLQQNTKITFKVFDLREDKKYQIYQMPNTLSQMYQMQKLELMITNIWQMKKNVYLMITMNNRKDEDKDGIINNNYICDTKTKELRQTKFNFGKWQSKLSDGYYLGNLSVFTTMAFDDGKMIDTPIFYVDNETQTIIKNQLWKYNNCHHFETPGYDSGMLCDSFYQKQKVEGQQDDQFLKFKVESKKMIDLKHMAMFFMIEMYPEFDDDFLQNVLESIDFA